MSKLHLFVKVILDWKKKRSIEAHSNWNILWVTISVTKYIGYSRKSKQASKQTGQYECKNKSCADISGRVGDATCIAMNRGSSRVSAGAVLEQRFSRRQQLIQANPSEGMGSCLFSPLWELPPGSGLQLALIKTTPVGHLGSGPTTALLVYSPKSILTLRTAELHFLCAVLVKACQRVRGPWEHLDYN